HRSASHLSALHGGLVQSAPHRVGPSPPTGFRARRARESHHASAPPAGGHPPRDHRWDTSVAGRDELLIVQNENDCTRWSTAAAAHVDAAEQRRAHASMLTAAESANRARVSRSPFGIPRTDSSIAVHLGGPRPRHLAAWTWGEP